MERLEEARKRLQEARRVAVLTGAGISKPSGIPTFRDAEGLWKEFNPLEYATPEAYAKDPEKVWAWYAWRIAKVREARPNPAHQALVELERQVLERGGEFLLVTQNVDGLHTRAGSRNLVELHGNILRARCEACGHRFPLPEAFTPPPSCPRCGHRTRPDVVWFGEFLPEGAWERAVRAFSEADVALIIGTSAEVEPAASLGRIATVGEARPNPAHQALVELERRVLERGGEFLLVTQNVDGLHARAGSRNLVELHGNILRARCEACGHRFPLPEAFTPPPSCPRCGHRARPDVVWFGEFLPEGAWERAVRAFSEADVALVIGTSAEVEPAASLGRIAYASGAYLVELNPEPTPLTPLAHLSLRMGAVEGMALLLP